MNGSSASNGTNRRAWLRRLHRSLGLFALVFVLLLASTGIALNHAEAWRLDDHHIAWGWVLDGYGIEAPAPQASFADGAYRATLLGERLYFGGREIARGVGALTGVVEAGGIVVVAAASDAFLLTSAGELVERVTLDGRLPGPIDALGRAGGRVVVQSGGRLFRFDRALANLEPWPGGSGNAVRWSAATPVDGDELATIRDLYRGRGVSIERLLLDLHSGRLFTRPGVLLMDLVGILLIVLALTGLWMWRRQRGR